MQQERLIQAFRQSETYDPPDCNNRSHAHYTNRLGPLVHADTIAVIYGWSSTRGRRWTNPFFKVRKLGLPVALVCGSSNWFYLRDTTLLCTQKGGNNHV